MSRICSRLCLDWGQHFSEALRQSFEFITKVAQVPKTDISWSPRWDGKRKSVRQSGWDGRRWCYDGNVGCSVCYPRVQRSRSSGRDLLESPVLEHWWYRRSVKGSSISGDVSYSQHKAHHLRSEMGWVRVTLTSG